MKIGLGHPAEKEDYYPRTNVVREITQLLENGENILISSPRRIGKTSILLHIENCPPKNYNPVYMYVGYIDTEEKFFEELFKVVTDYGGFSKSKKGLIKSWDWVKTALDDLTIKVGGAGIDFNTKARGIYMEAFVDLVKQIPSEQKLLLLIDEFPIAVSNIIKNQSVHEAIMFLEANRRLRIDPKINSKIQVVYTGSIGLRHVVKGINASDTINDLANVEVTPLSLENAKDLTRKLLESKSKTIEEDVLVYMLKERIQWLIPYFIQHYCYQLGKHFKEDVIDNREQIDFVVNHLVRQIDTNLDNYEDRLNRYFKAERRKFAKKILDWICEKDSIERAEIINLSNHKDHKVEDWKNVVSILKYDGYINNVGTPDVYRFNSPILKLWWYEFAR